MVRSAAQQRVSNHEAEVRQQWPPSSTDLGFT